MIGNLTRIVPIVIILTSAILFFLLPNWGEINLLFGFSVGIIGFGVTFVRNRVIINKAAWVLTLPVLMLWFYYEQGVEPILSLISVIVAYPWQATNERSSKTRESISSSDNTKDKNLFVESLEIASEPVGCVMVATAALIVGSVILTLGIGVNPIVVGLAIFGLSTLGITISLVVGIVINKLYTAKGTSIQVAVFLGVPFAFLMAIAVDSQINLTVGESLREFTPVSFVGGMVGAFIGAFVGSLVGIWHEKSSKPDLLYPEGTWERAREVAIKTFKNRISKYHWRYENVQIDSFKRYKGKGTLDVTIMERKPAPFDSFRWWPVERYRLIIDRSGDILEMQALLVKEEEKYKPPSIEDHLGLGYTSASKRGIELGVIDVSTKVTSEGLTVRIEFPIRNYGSATRIYPIIEYKIAELRDGKYKERIVRSPTNWMVELKEHSITPITFDNTFEATAMLLAKPPNKVTVKLHRKPRK